MHSYLCFKIFPRCDNREISLISLYIRNIDVVDWCADVWLQSHPVLSEAESANTVVVAVAVAVAVVVVVLGTKKDEKLQTDWDKETSSVQRSAEVAG